MSDTLTRIPVGSRVLYIGGGEENNADLIGKFGTVRQDDNTITLPYYVEFDGSSYNRWWCPPEALVVVPKVGDKVTPVNGERVGIPAPYLNAVGTVSEVEYMPGATTKCVVRAEFQSHQKPDDTVEWSMNEWKPADEPITFATRHRLIGKFIRVRYSGSTRVREGEVHKVTGVWNYREDAYDPKVDGITVAVNVDGGEVYVQAYEMVEDGETLTVSQYRPAVGDRVLMTGYLDSDGITDCTHSGIVTRVEGDIWTVTVDEREFVTGPGYVSAVLDTDIVEPVRPSQETPLIGEMRDEIATLKRELERANERVEEFSRRAGKWERDFGRLSSRVLQEAIDRDWCSQYEEVMEDVEADLEIATLPKRRKRTRRAVKIRGEVWVETHVWVDDDCDDEDDPDNWYEDEDSDEDEPLGSDWCHDRLNREYENNGFDDTEFEAR